jgi:acyl carrier protein
VNTSKEAVAAWCQGYVASLLEVPADAVDPDASFDRLGVDSAIAVSLLIEVEERYGIELPAETLFESRTVNAVAEYLSAQCRSEVGRSEVGRSEVGRPDVAQPDVA